MTIDMHTHVFPEKFLEEAKKKHLNSVSEEARHSVEKMLNQIMGRSPAIPATFCDVEKRIQDMSKQKVDLQVASVAPYSFFYDADPKLTATTSRIQNDMIAKLSELHPDRFVGVSTVPLQDTELAVEELDRAVKDLEMKGVEISPSIRGENLDDPKLWPFYEKTQQLDVPIMVHPISPPGADRMQRYYLQNLVGFPFETALGIASVILGGMLEKFKNIKFCFVHGGGFLPYQIGRLDHGYKVRPETKTHISKLPSEYMRKLYFDTTTHSQPALTYLIKTVGSEKVLLGSDYPYDMADPDPVSTVRKLRPISAKDRNRILATNAAKIFKIKA
jgi:aminocarboxymuconate-semialdehyde decarboxylase